MTAKLARTNGSYVATVTDPATGFHRTGGFATPEDAIGAIRAWKRQANSS